MDYEKLAPEVLQWLEELRLKQEPYGTYKMSRSTEATLFSSCFALFIRELCKDLGDITSKQRDEWTELISSSQDKQTGLFICPRLKKTNNWSEHLSIHHDWAYVTWQSTTFCLSALEVLGVVPRFPLRFLEKWKSEEVITTFFGKLDWDNGVWAAGNIAMFLGICLICDQELFGNDNSESIDSFFGWHDRFQDPNTGFWRTDDAPTLIGLFGAIHQFLIYYYMGRELRFGKEVVDNTLRFQERDGHFFPCGGGACEDYNASNTLVNMYGRLDYRRGDIEDSLRLLLDAVLKTRGKDGGFLWANRKRYEMKDWYNQIFSYHRYGNLKDWKWMLRKAVGIQLRTARNEGRSPLGWVDTPIPICESDLFSTWLRLLVIAEVSQIIQTPFSNVKWNFLKTPGLGWNDL